MIDDELLAKFDRIQDLPVSEEMLGAYLEGNLRGFEPREVQNLIEFDNNFADFFDNLSNDLSFVESIQFAGTNIQPVNELTFSNTSVIDESAMPIIPYSLSESINEIDFDMTDNVVRESNAVSHFDLQNDDIHPTNNHIPCADDVNNLEALISSDCGEIDDEVDDIEDFDNDSLI